MTNINKETRLNQIVNEYPTAMELFNDLEIDYCCNGSDSLDQVCQKKNIDLESLISLIEKNIVENKDFVTEKSNNLEEFKKLSIDEMINSLNNTHHVEERNMMLELDKLVNKILVVHYKAHSDQLIKLHALFADLKKELEEHFAKEEKLIFPLIEQNKKPTQEIIDYINDLESEHDAAGNIIKEIQEVTNSFTAPEDACMTYKRTFALLNEFVEDVFVHIFKENSVLFPKYEQLVA